MSPELPPLDPLPGDLDQLLDAERGFPQVPGAVEARMWSTIAAQAPATLPTHAPTALSQAGALAKVSAKWPLAVAFALGGGVGAGVHAALIQPAPTQPAPTQHAMVQPVVTVIAQPVVQTPPLPPPAVTPLPSPVTKPVVPHPSKGAAVPAAPVPAAVPRPAADDPSLTSERALLEMGRTALARGQNRAAYEAMVEHEQRFPTGRLAEERDAVRIQALVGLGQRDAARLLAQSFRAAYPKSLLRPAVDRAVGDAK